MYMLIPMDFIILGNYVYVGVLILANNVYVDSTGFWMLVNVCVHSTGFLNAFKLCICWFQWIL